MNQTEPVPTEAALHDYYAQGWETMWLEQVDQNLQPLETGYRRRMDATFAALQIPNNQALTVLDAGCGVGIYAINLAKRYPKLTITGFDLSEPQIEVANRLAREQGVAERCRFLVGNINTTILGQKFDFISCTELLEHLPDPKPAFKNLQAMGRASTRYVLSVPQYYHNRRQSGTFYKQVLPDGQEIHTQDQGKLVNNVPVFEYYHALYSIDEVKQLLRENGYVIEKIVGTSFVLAPQPASPYESTLGKANRRAFNGVAKVANQVSEYLSVAVDLKLNRWLGYRQAANLIIRCRQ